MLPLSAIEVGRRNGNIAGADEARPQRRGPRPTQVLTLMPITIRPDLTVLRTLPTIHQVSESWGKLELKLETADTRYWLTTEGVARKTGGTPINYVVDYVTVEKRSEDGTWDLKAVYSPEAWKLSQGFDYCQMLYQDLDRLQAKQEVLFSWETQAQIEGVERELEAVNRTLAALSHKVRLPAGAAGHTVGA
jgi:hypothetical protein